MKFFGLLFAGLLAYGTYTSLTVAAETHSSGVFVLMYLYALTMGVAAIATLHRTFFYTKAYRRVRKPSGASGVAGHYYPAGDF